LASQPSSDAPRRVPSHYELLQLPQEATSQQLRQAFRLLSKRFHPDTTTLAAAEAARGFQQLQQAYAVLSDPAARSRYDTELRLARLMAAAAATAAATAVSPVAPPTGSIAPSVRRALSGGEWLALLLLGLALIFSLVLGVGLALVRGAAFSTWPSWLPPS
jgi:curved DNA-binding protein CbpA